MEMFEYRTGSHVTDSQTVNVSRTYKLVSKADEQSIEECDRLTEERNPCKSYIPRRYILCALIFAGMFLMNSLRLNLSVAIVAMTSNRSVTSDEGTTIQVKEFDWNSEQKGYILSSYFYGYTLSEFPSGWIAGRFGGRNTFGLQILCAVICNFLIPTIADYGPYALFICRAMIGIFEGGSVPSIYALWAQWAPSNEKSLLVTLSIVGSNVANVVCFFLYGMLCTNFGWRALFYVPGVFTALWCVIWFVCVENRPADDRSISPNELSYIQNSVERKLKKKIIYPWKSILASGKVWSAAIGYFPQSWNYFFLIVELPSYFNDVWKINVKESGFLLMVSFGPTLFIGIACSLMADYLICRKKYSVTLVRKIIYAVAGFGTTIGFYFIGSSASPTEATIFVILTTCFHAFYFGSIFLAAVDLAPPYASVIMGIMVTCGSFAAIIAPVVTGYITPHQTEEEWRMPFYISSSVCFICTTVYLIFGSSHLQSWALDVTDDDCEM